MRQGLRRAWEGAGSRMCRSRACGGGACRIPIGERRACLNNGGNPDPVAREYSVIGVTAICASLVRRRWWQGPHVGECECKPGTINNGSLRIGYWVIPMVMRATCYDDAKQRG